MKSINPSWFRFLKVGCTQQGEWTSVCYRQASFTQGNILDQRVVKGAFKYYAILLGGGGSHQKGHKRSHGGGGVHQKITEDHDHGGGMGWHAKNLAKRKVLKKEIIIPRISYQWVAQKVISS